MMMCLERPTKRREYRSLLGGAKDKVVELESLLVDARA
jgi:hypothetical protein